MTETEPTVLVPAGVSLLDAAAWVGASCRAELDLHQRLTEVLAAGAGPERSPMLWAVRAHRAEIAEAWHRRLPELREFPRETFVADDASNGSVPGVASASDLTWVVEALGDLLARYRDRTSVAVGPADGPVADTLVAAIRRAEQDRDAVTALISA